MVERLDSSESVFEQSPIEKGEDVTISLKYTGLSREEATAQLHDVPSEEAYLGVQTYKSALLQPLMTTGGVMDASQGTAPGNIEAISEEEMDHIRRVMEMAEAEGILMPTSSYQVEGIQLVQLSPVSGEKEPPKTTSPLPVLSEPDDSGIDSSINDSILTGLSDEEVEHIRRITELANKEFYDDEAPPPSSADFWRSDITIAKRSDDAATASAQEPLLTTTSTRSNVFRRKVDSTESTSDYSPGSIEGELQEPADAGLFGGFGSVTEAEQQGEDTTTIAIAQEVAKLETELQMMNASLMLDDWDMGVGGGLSRIS